MTIGHPSRLVIPLILASCTNASPPHATQPPAPDAEVSTIASADLHAPAPETTAIQVPPVVRIERGWVRNADDPHAPLVRIEQASGRGDWGETGVDAIAAAASEVLLCWEHAVASNAEIRRGSAWINVRVPHEPDVHALTVAVAQDADESVRLCIDQVVRRRALAPTGRDSADVGFVMFARRDDALLEGADPARIVAIRAGGGCWQWKVEGPCPPRKRCYSDRWIRTTCGAPAMRDDVSLRFGLGTPSPQGAPLIDVRLVGGDGTVLWVSRLPPPFVRAYPRAPAGASSIAVHETESFFGVDFGASAIVLADAVGIQVYGRESGESLLTYQPPPPGDDPLWFDEGGYTIRRAGGAACEGRTGKGAAFAAACERDIVYFDGHTMAVFRGEPLALAGTQHLGARGTTRASERTRRSATFEVAGLQVDVTGVIFMH